MNVAFLRCETDGRISVDSAANLLEVVGNKRVSVFKDEDEVFKLLPVKEVVVELRMGIGNKASFCIVGNIADVEGMVTEGRSLDTGILGICGWDFDIVEVERNRIHEVRYSSSWSASTHHGVQQGRQCAGHLANTRHGAYLKYTQNIVLQNQGEDPTGKPTSHLPLSAALTLQQCLFGDTEERYHQPIDRSGLTPATRLQRSVGQRERRGIPRPTISSKREERGPKGTQRIPRTPFFSLRDAAHGKHAGRKTNVVSQKQI
ncbi:hypothetical protein TNCV_2526001 [Trichonephila clavipes]|nr:hypothetical protein TNCV_2526001 [Trichonephila clavipes]